MLVFKLGVTMKKEDFSKEMPLKARAKVYWLEGRVKHAMSEEKKKEQVRLARQASAAG